jgi:isochorismate pyruvate lyase
MKRRNAAACRNLREVRAEIDRIDRELLRLISKRGTFVRRAAELKARRKDVRDRARISAIVAEVRKQAGAYGLNAAVVGQAFRAMIDRFVDYEFKEFDRRRRR